MSASASMVRPLLIMFAKWPEAGRVKSRLGAEIGMERAAAVYGRMVDLLVERFSSTGAEGAFAFQLHVAPADSVAAFEARYPQLRGAVRPQSDDPDLGARMRAAFAAARGEGCAPVALIGSDCLLCTRDDVAAALALAASPDVDAVFGPATDGGYWLVACGDGAPAPLLEGIAWSTPDVWAQTQQRAGAHGLRLATVRTLPDCDTRADLEALPAGVRGALLDAPRPDSPRTERKSLPPRDSAPNAAPHADPRPPRPSPGTLSMVKKVLIGSLVVLALGVLGFGAFIAYSLYQIQAVVDEVEEVEDAFRATNERFPYDGLTTATLTEDRFRAFLAIRREVADALDTQVEELRTALRREEERARAGAQPGTLALMSLLRSHFAQLRKVPLQQVEALAEHAMSAREYRELTRALMQTARASSIASTSAAWNHYEASADRWATMLASPTHRTRAPAADPEAAGDDDDAAVAIVPAGTPPLGDDLRAQIEELLRGARADIFDARTTFLDIIVLQFDATRILDAGR